MPRWEKLSERQYLDKWLNKLPSGCWEYKGKINNWGYGRHRYFFERITKEKIPAGFHLDHLCRNKKCCNPSHLEIVTVAENIRRGKLAKLNPFSVKEIIHQYSKGIKQMDIARYFRVNQSTVSRIVNQLRWS